MVLDPDRLGLDLLRTLGLAAPPLWIVVLLRGLRLDVDVGWILGPGVGELGVVARLRRLVPLRLLQQLVVGRGLVRWRVLSRVLSAL